jgi:glycosyltransferase involved in cell wall biosynthesis
MGHDSPWANTITQSLQAQGHEIHVLDFEEMAFGGMPTNEADTKRFLERYDSAHLVTERRSFLALVGPLRMLARRLEPDLVLCLYGGRFSLAAYLSGVRPYAVYVVGSDVLLASRTQRWINRVVLNRAALVIANGEFLAAQTRKQAPRARVETLLLGVDVKTLQPRTRLAMPRIFNHRTFSATYNNESIIRALAALGPDVPPFEMIFASGGPQLEQAIALADAILPPHIRPRVQFWRGKALRNDILSALAESDFYVSMTRSDGTATSVLEAMSCGVFPILSDIPPNRPLVDLPAGIGALVPLEDQPALVDQIRRCLQDVPAYRARAERIRSHVSRFANSTVNLVSLARSLASAANVSA